MLRSCIIVSSNLDDGTYTACGVDRGVLRGHGAKVGALPLCPADSELLVASSSMMILTLLLSPAQPLIGIPRNQLVASYSCCLDTLLDISTRPVLHSPLCVHGKKTPKEKWNRSCSTTRITHSPRQQLGKVQVACRSTPSSRLPAPERGHLPSTTLNIGVTRLATSVVTRRQLDLVR